MAKQNFINGGFRGKLGAVVGRGWKDINVLATYCATNKSNTEKQQKARREFKKYILAAQKAQEILPKMYYFESGRMSQFNMATSLAKKLADNGNDLLDIIPLIPEEIIPTYKITDCTLENFHESGELMFSVSGNLPNKDMVIKVLLWKKKEVFDPSEVQILNADYFKGAEPTIFFNLPKSITKGDVFHFRFFLAESGTEDAEILNSVDFVSDGSEVVPIEEEVTNGVFIRTGEYDLKIVIPGKITYKQASQMQLNTLGKNFEKVDITFNYRSIELQDNLTIINVRTQSKPNEWVINSLNGATLQGKITGKEDGVLKIKTLNLSAKENLSSNASSKITVTNLKPSELDIKIQAGLLYSNAEFSSSSILYYYIKDGKIEYEILMPETETSDRNEGLFYFDTSSIRDTPAELADGYLFAVPSDGIQRTKNDFLNIFPSQAKVQKIEAQSRTFNFAIDMTNGDLYFCSPFGRDGLVSEVFIQFTNIRIETRQGGDFRLNAIGNYKLLNKTFAGVNYSYVKIRTIAGWTPITNISDIAITHTASPIVFIWSYIYNNEFLNLYNCAGKTQGSLIDFNS